MFISVQELELHEVGLNQEFQPGALDLGQDLQQQSPLKVSGRAELVEENRGGGELIQDIRLVGNLNTQVGMRCARCLEPVTQDVRQSFDLLYRPIGVDAKRDEVSICEAETEIGFYQGEGIALEDVLKEQILLAVPVKVVCREECKGFCPHCGENLNDRRCLCEGSSEDPRWAALAEIRKNLKH